MFKLLRMALFAMPLASGVAFAQGSGTSGSAGAPGTAGTGTATATVPDDTRSPTQQKAGKIDDTMPALPGDATKPVDIPNTVPKSDRSGMPDTTDMTTPGSGATDKKVHKKVRSTTTTKTDESRMDRKSDVDHDSTRIDNNMKAHDTTRDQLDSDK
ncbi:MAG: hypothetical protein JWN44_4339 [Myxococcales bacterium]|nr:hypothetical protein [Myxococcales bacterium]